MMHFRTRMTDMTADSAALPSQIPSSRTDHNTYLQDSGAFHPTYRCAEQFKKVGAIPVHTPVSYLWALVLLRYNIPELKQDITKTKHCRKCLRDDCRPGSTLNPHMKSIHKQQIQSNIHEHGNNQTIKRRPAVANRAQYICTHVINRHKYNAI